jgi:hypothetical protein
MKPSAVDRPSIPRCVRRTAAAGTGHSADGQARTETANDGRASGKTAVPAKSSPANLSCLPLADRYHASETQLLPPGLFPYQELRGCDPKRTRALLGIPQRNPCWRLVDPMRRDSSGRIAVLMGGHRGGQALALFPVPA